MNRSGLGIRTLESYDQATDRTDIAWELNAVARALDSRSKMKTWPESDARAMRLPSGLLGHMNSKSNEEMAFQYLHARTASQI